MLVKDVMSTSVVTVLENILINEVAGLMLGKKISTLPVVNDADVVVGSISERELFSNDGKIYLPFYVKMLHDTAFLAGGSRELPYTASQLFKITAADVMNREVYLVSPETTVEKVVELILTNELVSVPVTD